MWSVDTFKKDSKHKEDDYFPISWCQFRVAGGQSPPSRSEWKAGTQPGQDALPSRRARARAHTHAHALRLGPLDTPSHLSAHTSLGRGKKLESPEKTHIDMERMYELHTDSGPCWEEIFFFPHWRYNKTIRNETTFEDLHYVAKIKGRKEGSSRVLNGCWKPTPYYSL